MWNKSCAIGVGEKKDVRTSKKFRPYHRHVVMCWEVKKREQKIYDKDYVKISLWNDNKKEYNAQGKEERMEIV